MQRDEYSDKALGRVVACLILCLAIGLGLYANAQVSGGTAVVNPGPIFTTAVSAPGFTATTNTLGLAWADGSTIYSDSSTNVKIDSKTGNVYIGFLGTTANVVLNATGGVDYFEANGNPIMEVSASGVLIGTGGSNVTNLGLGAQGGCSMNAGATTCTVAVAGCTVSSICLSSPFGTGATADAIGVSAACAAGTVTLTAKTGPTVNPETFNVFCFN